MKHLLAAFVTLVVIGLITRDALDVGFLADDWYLGERIVLDQRDHPGLFNRLVRSVTNTWAPTYEVFRPLTILTIELDYEVFGADPGKHHYQSMLWWGALALILGHMACRRAKVTGAFWPAALAIWFGSFPGLVEALAWLVARQDLILGVSAAAALGSVMFAPDRGWRHALWTIPGYLGKETAIVLPPMLFLSDLILHPKPAGRSGWRHFLERLKVHAPAVAVGGLYLAARWCLFGSALGTYNGKSMAQHLADRPGLLSVIGQACVSGTYLFLPTNATVVKTLAAEGMSRFAAPLITASGFVLAGFGLVLRDPAERLAVALRAIGRDLLLLVVWSLIPLTLLAIPGNGVTPELAQGRFLVLPFIALAMIVGPRIARAASARPTIMLPLLAASAMMGASMWRVNLDAFRHATNRATTIAADVIDGVKPSEHILLDGWWFEESPGGPVWIHPYIDICDGAYVFGGAVGSVVRPPFVPPPGMQLELVTPAQARFQTGTPSELARRLTSGKSAPIYKRLDLVNGEPRAVDIYPREATFTLGQPSPNHGDTLRRDSSPRFSFQVDVPPRADTVSVYVMALSGEGAVADIPIDLGSRAAGGMMEFDVPGALFHLEVKGTAIEHALDAAILSKVPHDVVVWWVEVSRDNTFLGRSPPLAVRLQ